MPDQFTGRPLHESGYEPWHSGLDAGRVLVTRCHACKRWQWYPLLACPQCGNATWDWEDVGKTGVVHAWTRVMRPTVQRAGLEPPYVIGVIELPQAGDARVVALATDDGDPVIGSEVCLEIRQIEAESALFFA